MLLEEQCLTRQYPTRKLLELFCLVSSIKEDFDDVDYIATFLGDRWCDIWPKIEWVNTARTQNQSLPLLRTS